MKNRLLSRGFSVAMVGCFLFLGLPLIGASQSDTSNGVEPAEYVVEDIQGSNVQVLEEGVTQWAPAVEGQEVASGDEIKIGGNSEATLMLENETSVHLSENSDMKVEKIASNETGGFLSRLQVLAGLLLADVKKNLQDSHSTFEVESNGVVCGVRGTAFEVNAQGDASQVSTHEGKVEVTNGGESHMVPAGNLSSFKQGKFQLQRRLDRSEIQRFKKWRTFRKTVQQKRLQRITAIKNHARQPWQRKQPQPINKKPVLKHELDKKKPENHPENKKLKKKSPHKPR